MGLTFFFTCKRYASPATKGMSTESNGLASLDNDEISAYQMFFATTQAYVRFVLSCPPILLDARNVFLDSGEAIWESS